MSSDSLSVPLTFISIQSGLSLQHPRTSRLVVSIVSPLSVPNRSISLIWGMLIMGTMVSAVSSIGFSVLLGRTTPTVVMVPMSLPNISAVPSLWFPLFSQNSVTVLIPSPAPMTVVRSSLVVTSVSVLSIPVVVAMVFSRVRVAFSLNRLLMAFATRLTGFVTVPAIHHQGAVEVSLHVGVQVKGGGQSKAVFRVQLVEQGLTAGPYVVPPQLVGPLLPHRLALCCPLVSDAHNIQNHRNTP